MTPHQRFGATEDRYVGGDYLAANPHWHAGDSPWKAAQVLETLDGWRPTTVCEVGCGAGVILRELHDRLPDTTFVGFEISPDALRLAAEHQRDGLEFRLQDAATTNEHFDLMLVIDVIEHLPDPIAFLTGLRDVADRVVLHIPLDLSVQSVLRPHKLLDLRRQVGHIHSFTPETAVSTVQDAGYRVTGTRLTRTFDRPAQSIKARAAKIPRTLLPPALTVRVLGGYSLMVSAQAL